jgi:hypothetical protein
VAAALAPLVTAGRVAGVLLEDDEGVLVANRLPGDIPVVDEVPVAAVLAAGRVALEVARDGRTLQVLTDPLKLATALGLDAGEMGPAAALAAELYDATSAAVVLDPQAAAEAAGPTGWIEVGGSRLSFLAGHQRLRAGQVGDGSCYALPPALHPVAVDDLWTVNLAEVSATVLARRAATGTRPVGLAALHASASLVDPAEALTDLLGVPVATAASEAAAARLGALTTPGAPPDAVVVDVGGGTIDLVSPTTAVVAAGAGDLLTACVGAITGTSTAAAEWVKRGPAHRVEAPQVLLGEHGERTFLDQPAPPESVGSLVVRGPAGLLGFAPALAPGEWRALRLRLKTDLVGGNVARALRSAAGSHAGTDAPTVIVVGGSAGDDEVLAAVAGALPAATAVARGDVAGGLGHRYAVALGLLLAAG